MTEAFSRPLVLASGSPRRRVILAALGLPFEVLAPAVDERVLPDESLEAAVRRLAAAKALAGLAQRPDSVVLAADTLVGLDRRILGKPTDPAEAVAMLHSLSGRSHEVWTGVAVAAAGRALTVEAERSSVLFRLLSDAEISTYVASGEPLDKAGAYALQGGAAAFVTAVEGQHDNVIGLPLALSARLLAPHFPRGRLELA